MEYESVVFGGNSVELNYKESEEVATILFLEIQRRKRSKVKPSWNEEELDRLIELHDKLSTIPYNKIIEMGE